MGQHHEHQLAGSLDREGAWASWIGRGRQHHEHQPAGSLAREGARASIMSISWPVLWIGRRRGPAS